MDPSIACKVFFSLGTAIDLGGTLMPSFRERVMNYGSRNIDSQSTTVKSPRSRLMNLFEYVASFQVPHTWFTHYYIVSVASSLFWAHQILTHGPVFEYLASYSSGGGGMTVNQVFLAWLFMTIQGLRRLYESLTLTKPSKSKMWVGLWLIGIAYYIFMGLSVWIDGIGSLSHGSMRQLRFSRPSAKTVVAIPLFLLASGVQNICHRHLASLKKYTLPQQRFFQSIVCPHYTSECLIYVAIAILAAPQGYYLNRTVLAGLGFVVSNLAVTADSTRRWYVEKFGAENLAGRWRMVPYVY